MSNLLAKGKLANVKNVVVQSDYRCVSPTNPQGSIAELKLIRSQILKSVTKVRAR